MQHYEDWEIRELYLGAKDKEAEIAILAQICLTSENAIKQRLVALGLELPGVSAGRITWTPEKAEDLRRLRGQGKTNREIAEIIGASVDAVSMQFFKMRRHT